MPLIGNRSQAETIAVISSAVKGSVGSCFTFGGWSDFIGLSEIHFMRMQK
jgi:hypothetical protein